MKILCAAPAIPRFEWEVQVLLASIRRLTDMEVVLLFTEHDFTVPAHFRKKPGVSVSVYSDRRDDKDYIPSVRPYLLWQYLAEDPAREQEQYFYIDSDIIFRAWIDCATLGANEGNVVGSTCDSYIGLAYIEQCQRGPEIAAKIAEICGTTVEAMRGVPGIGAHLVLTNPTAAFWQRSYEDSNEIYHYLEGVDTNVQKWTAEMWAQVFGWVREGKTLVVSQELGFCLPTDPIEKWDTVNILHNAGILADKSHEYFFKGQYVNYSPLGRNFDFVRRDKCTYRYIEAIQNVLQ